MRRVQIGAGMRRLRLTCRSPLLLLVALAAVSSLGLSAEPIPAARTVGSAEAATARRLASIRDQPSQLTVFLREMPKGADLHNHLSGAVYAESYLRWAVEDNLCLVTATLAMVAPPCDAAAGRPLAATALRDTPTFNQVIDEWSMRHWEPQRNGHDHFFAAFAKFGPTSDRTGDMLAEVTARAAAEHVSYLELMWTPDGGAASQRGRAAGWDPDFARERDRLLAAGFTDVIPIARQRLDAAEARRQAVQHCGTPQADPGCLVTVRYISQVGRTGLPEQVFAQMLSGFELTAAEPRIVGLNLVQPEDDPAAIRDFSLQMRMLDFLRGLYPSVAVTLHAGELAEGLVPPESLRFHIRESVDVGHARRIGHGVDVMLEDDPLALLRDMAAKHVLVEIALSSNDQILGVKGKRHPLSMYLQYGVPVALVTDDAGVARSSHAAEFRKAVEEQGLDYKTLKTMVRHSLEYAFVEGKSLWADVRGFRPVSECSPARGGIDGSACRAFGAANAKARLERELEAAFRVFEQRQSVAMARK